MSYTDRVWSAEARDKLRMNVEQLTGDDLRLVLLTVISEANPDYLLSALRGAITGAIEIRKEIAALGIEETTADATLLAEMSALRAELEAAREDNAALLIALREIDSSQPLPSRVQRLLNRIRQAEHPGRALMAELTRRMSELERERGEAVAFEEDYHGRLIASQQQEQQLRTACEGLIITMVQLGKEHHREVAFARSVLGIAGVKGE